MAKEDMRGELVDQRLKWVTEENIDGDRIKVRKKHLVIEVDMDEFPESLAYDGKTISFRV